MPRMALEALLVSRDAAAQRVLGRIVPDFGMELRLAQSHAEAQTLLKRRKFDALIVDCELPDAPELLQKLRQGRSNRLAIVFAIVRQEATREAFALGANFVLDRPLTVERTQRSFRAAQGLIQRERRRYFRHNLGLPVTLDFGNGTREWQFTIVNMSEGGLGVRGSHKLATGTFVRICFTLPGPVSIDSPGEVLWSDDDGRAGIRLSLPPSMRLRLASFLGNLFQEQAAVSR